MCHSNKGGLRVDLGLHHSVLSVIIFNDSVVLIPVIYIIYTCDNKHNLFLVTIRSPREDRNSVTNSHIGSHIGPIRFWGDGTI
jgi:hypothetical protein